MKSTTKIVVWASVALVLAGGAVGIYFLVKPKENDTKTGKDGLDYIYKDGKWELNTGTMPTPTKPSNGNNGSSTGHKSCYNANVEKLQIYLNNLGAKLDTDGCIGDKTNNAMKKYNVEFDGNKYWKKSESTNTEVTSKPLEAERIPAKVGEKIYTEKTISTKKPAQIYRRSSSILFSVIPLYNEVKPNYNIGTMTEFKKDMQGNYYAGFVDSSGNNIYVNYNNVYSLK